MSAGIFVGLAALAGGILWANGQHTTAPASPVGPPVADGVATNNSPAVATEGGTTNTQVIDPDHPSETLEISNDGSGPVMEPSTGAPNPSGAISPLGLSSDGPKSPNEIMTAPLHTDPTNFSDAVYGVGTNAGRHLESKAIKEWGPIVGGLW